jgi:hypothetical protein
VIPVAPSTRAIRRAGTSLTTVAALLLMTASSAQAAAPAALVARVLVSAADIPVAYRVVPAPDGWQDEATVDNFCTPNATTDRFRRARQVVVVVTGQETAAYPSAKQEVVAYDTPARAALAANQWRAAATRCTTMTLTIFGDVYDIKSSPLRADSTLLIRDNSVEMVTMTSSNKRVTPSLQVVVIQRGGQVLNIVRGNGQLSDKARIVRNTLRIARNTGKRQAVVG